MKLSDAEKQLLSRYLYLRIRFQSGHIHSGLDKRTLRKAGRCESTLRRYLGVLALPGKGRERLAVNTKDVRWRHCTNPFQLNAQRLGGWALAPREVLDRWIRHVLVDEPCRAKHTIRIDRTMDIHAIRVQLSLKAFEHFGAQVLHAGENGKGNTGAGSTNGEGASNDVMRQYAVHPNTLGSVAVKHQAPMPSKAFSKKLGISQRTFWRRMRQWTSEGSIRRTRRRIHLPGPPEDPAAFRKQWGCAPFKCGGLWYAQQSNLYEFMVDYRGPFSEMRHAHGGYGKTIPEMLARVRKRH